MKKDLTGSALAFLVIVSQVSGLQAAAPLPGAIFTTVVDGTIVNANTQYLSKCAVYLDGGPGPNAPAKAAGLPSGDYFFQVTDPSGQTLLSTDVVNNRRFHVANGVITAFTGTGGPVHPIGIDQDHPELGATTIGLANTSCPADFQDTPNAGGVYKAWVTPVGNFMGDPTKVDNACGNGCFHGFAASTSKTDNFKVKPTTPTFTLTITTRLGSNPASNWPVVVTDTLGVPNTYTTDENGVLSIGGLVAGNYTVTSTQGTITTVTVNGTTTSSQIASFSWTAGQPAPTVILVFLESEPG